MDFFGIHILTDTVNNIKGQQKKQRTIFMFIVGRNKRLDYFKIMYFHKHCVYLIHLFYKLSSTFLAMIEEQKHIKIVLQTIYNAFKFW